MNAMKKGLQLREKQQAVTLSSLPAVWRSYGAEEHAIALDYGAISTW